MTRFFWSACFCIGLITSSVENVYAVYNANYAAPIAGVWVYDGGNVAVKLSTMPTTGCPHNDFFVIPAPPEVSDITYKAMYARALSALAMKETINIGYDNAGGDCAGTRPRVLRIGN